MSIELLQPLLKDGIHNVNFFNGRLLTAEDLDTEQAASRQQHRGLGKAVGEGVAYGLEVSKSVGAGAKPVVNVAPGLAINRNGAIVRLSGAVDVSLVRPQDGSATASGPVFSDCQPFQTGVYVAGSGVYLLTISPVSGPEGRAPVSGLQNTASDCNTKYIVDGVRFRLIQLDLTADELNDQNHLRNTVAYRCFGVADTKSFASDPFGRDIKQYGLLDGLRPNRLTDCDVPLAVLFWTASEGIKFIDMWSVRRRLIDPSATGQLNLVTGDRRPSEAEAIFMQFGDQLEGLRSTLIHPESAVVTDHFRYLPPVGLMALTGVGTGFNYSKFFEGRVYFGPVFIEGSRVEPLVRHASAFAPIDLSKGEMVWLYIVRENRDARAFAGSPTPITYLIFASGHMPFFGEARFDVARWDYSNYTSPLAF